MDSGWAVAIPSPLAKGSTRNAEQELVIRHVLEQTQQTPLRKPSRGQTGSAAKGHVEGGVRFAVRPEMTTVDGWRSAGPALVPAGDKATAQGAPPQARPAIPPVKRNYEFECDCNGMSDAPANATAGRDAGAARVPSASGPSLPQLPTPAEIEEAPAVNTLIEEASKEGEPEPAQPEPNTATEAESADTQSKEVPVETAPGSDAAKVEPQAAASAPAKTKPPASAPATKAPAADFTAASELPPLTRQLVSLKNRVRSVLKGYYRKPLNSREHDPWEVMHGMLAYGVHSRIRQGGPRGEPITSVGWLCYNKPCKGQTLMYVTPKGELRAKYGVGLQGHLGQLLAMLAQCHVSPDYPIRVGKHEFTIHDLIEAEKKTCYPEVGADVQADRACSTTSI